MIQLCKMTLFVAVVFGWTGITEKWSPCQWAEERDLQKGGTGANLSLSA